MKKNFSNQLPEVKIFLPNRRSCRELRSVFSSNDGGMMLPKIKAISDISYEDFFDFLPESESGDVKKIIDEILQAKVISGVDYLFFLSEEIQKSQVFACEQGCFSSRSFKIAIHLQKLFDEIEREEIDLKKLSEIDDSDLSQHRILTLDFLKNFHLQIKNSLLKKDIFLPTSYQNFVINQFAQLLERCGSKAPIIIAGSTGSVSLSKKLIKAISLQKNGYVVLRGMYQSDSHALLYGDPRECGARLMSRGNKETYQSDSPQEHHPQFFLDRLINFLEIEKNSVQKIAGEEFRLSDEARQRLLTLTMLPSEESEQWHQATLEKKDLDLSENIQLIEAKNEVEEAKIIALILLENFQQQKTSAVITNNKKLAELVRLELNVFSLPFNDARNIDVFSSKLINFLFLILELLESYFNSHSLLTILKNPLCYHSQNKEILEKFEIQLMRQSRAKAGLKGMQEKIKSLGDVDMEEFFQKFYCELGGLDLAQSFLIQRVIEVVENLSQKTWQELLGVEPAQSELFDFFEQLKLQTKFLMKPSDALASLKVLLSQINYFEKSDAMSPIQILSTLEARLLNFDLVVIASLNEGDFPEIESENWLGKKIEKDLGIDATLKKIGQNSYDFCNYLSNESVVLTRCKGRNGMVLIESPFLLKFKTLCKKIGVKIGGGEEYFSLLRNLNDVESKRIEAPQPKPKIEFRPTKISITEISKLISNPYDIYAKKILQLNELKKIDFEPSYAEFGSFVHGALEEFVSDYEERNFLEIFKRYFEPEESELIWWPKFENIFSEFLEENKKFFGLKNYVEVPVKLRIGNISISGKIDRVICGAKNEIEIFDYKTGAAPTIKSVTSGLDPQLTIAALALAESGIKSLNYWKLSASANGEIMKICKSDEELQILISAAQLGLKMLFEYFADEKNPYIATATNERSEYRHLIRAEEWDK